MAPCNCIVHLPTCQTQHIVDKRGSNTFDQVADGCSVRRHHHRLYYEGNVRPAHQPNCCLLRLRLEAEMFTPRKCIVCHEYTLITNATQIISYTDKLCISELRSSFIATRRRSCFRASFVTLRSIRKSLRFFAIQSIRLRMFLALTSGLLDSIVCWICCRSVSIPKPVFIMRFSTWEHVTMNVFDLVVY